MTCFSSVNGLHEKGFRLLTGLAWWMVQIESLQQGFDSLAPRSDELISYLTRFSPRTPDLATALHAFVAVACALVLLWIWKRWKRPVWTGWRVAILTLVAASFIEGGVFLCSNLLHQLFEEPGNMARERPAFLPESRFEGLLREAADHLPEKTGIMIINCMEMRQADLANYFLYPRKILMRRFSFTAQENPRKLLTEEIREQLRSLGAQWILDLSPRALKKGLNEALIRLDVP